MSVEIIRAEGLLWIGDPHQSSRTPGRRKDVCFHQTVARKIAQCMKMAEERNLIPVFGGDFFDRDDDTDAAMLVATFGALKTSGHRPWTLVGNHEKRRTAFTTDTSLGVLVASGLMQKVPDNGVAFVLEAPGQEGATHRIAVGGTGYDHEVPTDVLPVLEGLEVEDAVWLTHHDWAFKGSYPNAVRPFEIKGCGVVINGHNHETKPPWHAGKTTYFNPGNITRMSIDTNKHIPKAWMYRPSQPLLHGVELEHEHEVFDWTGRQVKGEIAPEKEVAESAFVTLMAKELLHTQEGGGPSDFLTRLNEFCRSEHIDSRVKECLADLFDQVQHAPR
jgi:hypothetical protein